MTFQRYAIYHLPDDPALAAWGAAWLGWDVLSGSSTDAPLPEVTQRPRRYGFHATIKPPFALMDGADGASLETAAQALCARLAPVELGLQIAPMGRFLALRPTGDTAALDAMAFEVVQSLDNFRAPPGPDELTRRRGRGLGPVQEEMLKRWGYPHVGPAFRFHMTLTGPLDDTSRATVLRTLADDPPPIPTPYVLRSLSLMGEDDDGRFHRIARLPLGSAHL